MATVRSSMKLLSLFSALFIALFSNCKEEVKPTDIVKIQYGTSFGMCLGYCTQTITLTNGLVSKTVTPRNEDSLEEKSCSNSFDGFNALASSIDINAFNQLDEVIGCPDCADGGAEWIGISTSEKTKKVTFEYQNEPEAVADIIQRLRDQYDRLGTCN